MVAQSFTPLEIPPREFLTSISNSNGVYARNNFKDLEKEIEGKRIYFC